MEPPARRPRLHRHNPRGILPDQLALQHMQIKDVMNTTVQAHIWTCSLRLYSQNHSGTRSNRDYNNIIINKAKVVADVHDRATDMAIPTTLFSSLYVHGVLEITYDVKILTNLAATNKAMWTTCKTLTTTEALNTKVWTNIPERSRQVSRPVPREDLAALPVHPQNARVDPSPPPLPPVHAPTRQACSTRIT